jgi:ATP-dependent DNA helicase DinG
MKRSFMFGSFADERCRLLETNPEIQRDEVIAEHIKSTESTVFISPSLYTGLDLKDNLSRFQIITKVPYPGLGDRCINKKRKKNGQWYIWQTALRFVQAYGRLSGQKMIGQRHMY